MGRLVVAMISDLFVGAGAPTALSDRMSQAAKLGAGLVMLPEIPMNPWRAASRTPVDDDAEPPEGGRHRMLAQAARRHGIGILGGVIVIDPATGARHNTALLFDASGRLAHSWRKLHLPEEEGFWESSHYRPGDDPPTVVHATGMTLGVQICSDVNRPEGSHLLGAMGAEAILCPRATESGTWPRWRTVLQANAMTSACYVLTVNRPAPEAGVPLGGPSAAISPSGEVLVETTDPVSSVTLESSEVVAARSRYPGYLPVRASVYARGWARVAEAKP